MNKGLPNYGAISSTSAVEFDDSQNEEFNKLYNDVVTSIYTINSSWKFLENVLKNLGTKRDNHSLRDKIHSTQMGSNKTISESSKQLQQLMILVRNKEKQKKLQIQKLMENFKEAVAKYSTLQKQVAEKMKANLLVDVSIENNPNDNFNQQKQLQLSRELAFEQDMLLERENRIQEIEEDILDVNQIMKDLSVLVYQQGDKIDSIENCIDHAVGNVEDGTEELVKASRYQSRYRKKLCILMLIAIVIVSVLIAFIVVELKKS